MNSRQRRKAWYNSTHEAPVKNQWNKTNEFGKIGECSPDSKYYKQMKKNEDRMRSLKYELKALNLWNKHTGSSKHSKLKAAIKGRTVQYIKYKNLIAEYAAKMKEAKDIPEITRTGFMQTDLPKQESLDTYEVIDESN